MYKNVSPDMSLTLTIFENTQKTQYLEPRPETIQAVVEKKNAKHERIYTRSVFQD